MLNAIIIVVAVVLGGYLAFSKRLAGSSDWKATVTPLASIMGSGFLVSAPRLFGSRLQARYVGAQFEDDLNSRELDEFVVVDLSFWKKVRANLDLFLGVENLFDETFEVGKSADGLVTIGSPLRVHLGARLR